MYMKTTQKDQMNYIETPRAHAAPVKIDSILEARMRAFMRARRMRRFVFTR